MNMQVTYSRKGDVHSIDTGGAALKIITVDNTNLNEDERGGSAKQLLGASALLCYCSALTAALNARGIKYDNLKASADIEVGLNDVKKSRIKCIKISACADISEDDEDVFERIKRIMQQGCLVTGSLQDGIEMEYALEANYIED